MESIERLRKYANGPCVYKDQKRVLLEIAEAFEVEHAEAYAQAYDNGYDEGFASADDWCADHEEAMAEHGWYRALCADRKPMLIGDRMEWANGTFTIHELKFTEDGCTTWDSEHGYTVHADECHHHEPTVEDVLTEMLVQAVGYSDAHTTVALSAIAEYAEKLQLRGDGE